MDTESEWSVRANTAFLESGIPLYRNLLETVMLCTSEATSSDVERANKPITSDSNQIQKDHAKDVENEIAELEEKIRNVRSERLKLRAFRFARNQKATILKSFANETQERANAAETQREIATGELLDSTATLSETSTFLQQNIQINGLNDAFCIWYNGPFAEINGFRLGRLPQYPVEWSEISAALGQCALALCVIQTRVRFSFEKYQLHSMGNFTKVSKRDDPPNTYYNLFSDGSFGIFGPRRNFNVALTGLLSCMEELGGFIAGQDPTLALPYSIVPHDGKVGDLCVFPGTPDATWTRAFKFLLSDLKWIVVWCTKHSFELH